MLAQEKVLCDVGLQCLRQGSDHLCNPSQPDLPGFLSMNIYLFSNAIMAALGVSQVAMWVPESVAWGTDLWCGLWRARSLHWGPPR